MRGNLRALLRHDPADRSIPAYAGEPARRAYPAADAQVYPRVCGGTRWQVSQYMADAGLSPRMRGNQLVISTAGINLGSIPAYAGEPGIYIARARVCRVYPRVCGGTL